MFNIHKRAFYRLLLVAVALPIITFAQDLNSSPYTRYGVGEVFEMGNSTYTGMAGASVAVGNFRQINYANPATYGIGLRHNPTFDAGYKVNVLNNQTSISSQRNVVTGLRNFGLLMPISPKTGLVVGLMPYSTVGYRLENKQLFDGDTITYRYFGKGSINRAIVGLGQQLINKGDSVRLSVGINASFLFGTLQQDRSVIYRDNSYYNTRITDKTVVRGLLLDAGLHYTQKLSKKITLQLGGNYTLGKQVNAFHDFYAYNFKYFNVVSEVEKDTLTFYEDQQGKLTLPSGFSAGFALSFSKKWLVATQYSIQNWQNYTEEFENISTTSQLQQLRKYAIGFEYTPTSDFDNRDISAVKLSTFRFGAHYGTSPFYVLNTPLYNYGINFGWTLPLISSVSTSTMNIGCELGQMGTTNNELIQQNYIKINLGFSLSSNSRFDRWFRKRLYE
jgi:hypothetical protein